MAQNSRLKFGRKLIVPMLCSYLLFQVCSCFEEAKKQQPVGVGESATTPWRTTKMSPCGSNSEGACVPRGECLNMGGTLNGNCLDGFGECCVFTQKCNENRTTVDVNQMVTTLESPTPANTQCTFRFEKEPDICQVRLDFEMYSSAGADVDGQCLTDRLRIRDSITVPADFSACGDLTGQHMYLTFGSQCRMEVTPILMTTSSRYRILATKIPCCDSVNRAPDYCLQYFTKPMDRVKSFDFGMQQQSNQRYTICVKPQGASNAVQWRPCSGVGGNAFDIISNPQAEPIPCITDWVQVKGLERACEPFSELTSQWKPYELVVNFDEAEFPPPPPTFIIPVDPSNCATACAAQSSEAYTCACLSSSPTNETICQCIINTPGPNIPVDFNNTGFCLDYTQI